MRGKDIKAGMVVAVSLGLRRAQPGEPGAKRAVVLDGDRAWELSGSKYDMLRSRTPVKRSEPSRTTGYACAVEYVPTDGRPPFWAPFILPSKDILGPWDEHLAIVEQVKADRKAASRREQERRDAGFEWAESTNKRLADLGLDASADLWSRTVKLSRDDIDRLLDLAEPGATTTDLA